MTRTLLPYGAKKYVALSAKGGVVKSARAAAATFAPYGSAANADLVAKAGLEKLDHCAGEPRRVIRLKREV